MSKIEPDLEIRNKLTVTIVCELTKGRNNDFERIEGGEIVSKGKE